MGSQNRGGRGWLGADTVSPPARVGNGLREKVAGAVGRGGCGEKTASPRTVCGDMPAVEVTVSAGMVAGRTKGGGMRLPPPGLETPWTANIMRMVKYALTGVSEGVELIPENYNQNLLKEFI